MFDNFDELESLDSDDLFEIYAFMEHSGTPHQGSVPHSGRYPYGSGEDPYQRDVSFLATYNAYKSKGFSEREIAEAMQIAKTDELRAYKKAATNAVKKAKIDKAIRMKEHGYSYATIAREMGEKDSTVRGWVKNGYKVDKHDTLVRYLEDQVKEKGVVDVGENSELYLQSEVGFKVSSEALKYACKDLERRGFAYGTVQVEQLGTGNNKKTSVQYLGEEGTEYVDLKLNPEKIKSMVKYTSDGEDIFWAPKYPESIDSSRILVRYAEDGGKERDGTIELRRNVADLSLGTSDYAQVRIAVDGKSYLKGMALYRDDIPPGYDVVFNTNKEKGTPLHKEEGYSDSVLKSMKADPDNPFGATIKKMGQYEYIGEDGQKHLGAINKVNEMGDWSEWKRSNASQMLSKQPVPLAKSLLEKDISDRRAEFDAIMTLKQPETKAKFLNEFADACDSAAVDLKAAALPGQQSHVILPINSLKENQVFAPNYPNGTECVLIRYPHGGQFEIPTVFVNNNNKEGISVIGKNAPDAIGIHHKVAEQLSGADFDGDSVLVIPNNDHSIKTKEALDGLKNFDPGYYKWPEGTPSSLFMTKSQKGAEMGNVSNLITDMTIQGATTDEICRAVRHSMVVIDAEKHHYNYKQSEIDHGIAELKEKYQGGAKKGASTIISKASSEEHPLERAEGKIFIDPVTGKKSRRYIDPETGEKLYTETGEVKTKYEYKYKVLNESTGRMKTETIGLYRRFEDGKNVYYNKKTRERVADANDDNVKVTTEPVRMRSTKMAETKDAMTLVRDNTNGIELAYAHYANSMKALANEARKASLSVGATIYNPEAAERYSKQVSSLESKLQKAYMNAPKERQAQIIGYQKFKVKKAANPYMDDDEEKRAKGQCLTQARAIVGASGKHSRIVPTEDEWEAINAGAVRKTTIKKILDKMDTDALKDLAMPKTKSDLAPSTLARIKSLSNKYNNSEIAAALNIPLSTVQAALR